LQRNLSLNRHTHVDVMACALAEAPGMLNFLAPEAGDPDSASGHVIVAEDPAAASIRVEARTLDMIAAEKQLRRIDLLKIDAEGYEWPVLQGAEKAIALFRPFIIFEFDQAYAVRGGDSAALFAAFFRRHGYRLFAVGRHWAELIDERSFPANANIFAAPLQEPMAGVGK
jgi:FkbM family methyltransferase